MQFIYFDNKKIAFNSLSDKNYLFFYIFFNFYDTIELGESYEANI